MYLSSLYFAHLHLGLTSWTMSSQCQGVQFLKVIVESILQSGTMVTVYFSLNINNKILLTAYISVVQNLWNFLVIYTMLCFDWNWIGDLTKVFIFKY